MKNEKISKSIKAKATARKIIILRTRARLRKFIAKEFPYVEVEKIKLDYFHLPKKLNKEYFEVLGDLKNGKNQDN
jgi:hypothetical protein